jgi:hypothetical protein
MLAFYTVGMSDSKCPDEGVCIRYHHSVASLVAPLSHVLFAVVGFWLLRHVYRAWQFMREEKKSNQQRCLGPESAQHTRPPPPPPPPPPSSQSTLDGGSISHEVVSLETPTRDVLKQSS